MTPCPLVVRCRSGCEVPACPSLKQRAGQTTKMAQMNRTKGADTCSVTLAPPECCKANSDQLARTCADASYVKGLDRDSDSTCSTASISSDHSTNRFSTPVCGSQSAISPVTQHAEMDHAVTPTTTKARAITPMDSSQQQVKTGKQSPSLAYITPTQSTSALTVPQPLSEGRSQTQVVTPPMMNRVISTAISSAASVPLESCRADADPIKSFDDDKDAKVTSSSTETPAMSSARMLLSPILRCREVNSPRIQHSETPVKAIPTTTKVTAITAKEGSPQRKGTGIQSLPVVRRPLKHSTSEVTRCSSITGDESRTQVVTPPTMAMMAKVNGTSSIRFATCASPKCLMPNADQLVRTWTHLGPIQGIDEEFEATNNSIATSPLGCARKLLSPETALVASTTSMSGATMEVERSSECLIPDADQLARSQDFDEEAEAEAARILSSPILGHRAVLGPGTQHDATSLSAFATTTEVTTSTLLEGSALSTGTKSPPVAKASLRKSTPQLKRSPLSLEGGQLVTTGTQSLPLAKLESRPTLQRSTSEPAFAPSILAEAPQVQVLTLTKSRVSQMKGTSSIALPSEAPMGSKTDLANTWEHPGPLTSLAEDAESTSNRKLTPTVTFAKVLSSPALRCQEITSATAQHSETPLTMSPATTSIIASEGSAQPKGTCTQPLPVARRSLKHSTSEVTRCPSITEENRCTQVVTPPTMATMAKMNGTSIRFAACSSPVSSPGTPLVTNTNAKAMAVAPLGGSMRLPVRANSALGLSASPSTIRPQGSPTSEAASCSKLHRHNTVTLGALLNPELKVTVVAPGGGTFMNRSVYSKLNQRCDISLEIVGKSGSPYDRYPEAWGPTTGAPSPNLESFAVDLVSKGTLGRSDCLVVGSRGGQVCLPTFWRMKGEEVPPAVILNGGCAMQLPISVPWPNSAVTFLLIGGQDYFRQKLTGDQYLNDVCSRVPHNNSTTAILMVQEMAHMPQAQLLDAILQPMVKAVTSWKEDRQIVPTAQFEQIISAVSALGFHGSLIYKTGRGDAWRATKIPEVPAGWQTASPQTARTPGPLHISEVKVVRRAASISL